MARSRRPKPGAKDFNEGIYHRPPVGMSFFTTGVLALIVILLLSYFAYTKELPWSSPGYTATATFDDASTLRETSPVRIAGVNVGEVTKVEAEGDDAKVTFTVDSEGLPLHEDARITIRPRLFLGGNYFLDLRPGSPSAPELPDGGSISVTQTATAVELDEILMALQRGDRKNLGDLLDGYGSALDDPPTPEMDVGMDPEVQGLSGAEAINRSFIYGGRAGKSSSQVSQALLGEQAGDLRGLIKSSASVFDQLASRESELSDLVTNFSITTGALAAESRSLQDTLAELAPTVEQAQRDLPVINSAFGPLRAFARDLTPSVEELPATIRAGMPWLRQADQLVQKSELGGIVDDLHASTPVLAQGTANLNSLLLQLGRFSRCQSQVLVPTGDQVIAGAFETGQSNFREFLYGTAAQAGEGATFDGNGQFLRVQPGGGPETVEAPIPDGADSPISPDNVNYGRAIAVPEGTEPLKPSNAPPVRTDVPCFQSDQPSLNGSQAGPGPSALSPVAFPIDP
ncbi:MAG TPA: MlaD family protein [Solirubrobacterales bacterium]|nr:MlaD family protein [Solirubrobacterales bacterium]